MLRFAANLSLLFPDRPLLERFAAAKEAGFGAVEMQLPYQTPAGELAAAREASGLPMVLINTPAGDLSTGERGLAALPGREADFEAAFGKALAYAQVLGVGMIHVMAGIRPAGSDPEVLDRTLVRNVRAALAASAGSGIVLLLEPLNPIDFPGYYLTRFAHARRLIEAAGDARVGLQLDLYNRQMSEGDPERGLREYIDIARHIQIAGAPGRHEPDIGEMDYRRLFKVIEELGYTGWIGCEYRPFGDTIAGLAWRKRLTAQFFPEERI